MSSTKAVFPATFKALGDEGIIEAMVSVYGNVDLQGDRVVKGAFAGTIKRWQDRGDPLPAVVSHDYGDLWAHIGAADPKDVVETDGGLKIRYTVDVKDNPLAAQAYRLMKQRRLKNHSFTYDVLDYEMKNGVRELRELDLVEFGPTLIGANPSTDVLAVKSALEEKTEQKTPPWHVEARDGQFCVIADETGETVKCHDTQGEADAHVAALYANVPDAGKTLYAVYTGGTTTDTFTVHNEPIDVKAGRRISKATRDKLEHLQEHITELLGEDVMEDEGKSLDPEPVDDGTPVIHEDLLRVRAQIEAF